MEVELNRPVMPQIAKYSCYRKFLGDFFIYKKSLKKSFSYRQFSQMVGLKSPNYLQLVIQGKRNLSVATADSVAKAMRLSTKECKYFISLVTFENAESVEEKKRAEKLVFQASRHMQTHFAGGNQKELFKSWHHLAVRELVLLKDFEPSGDYISAKLGGLISPEEGEDSLKFLLQAGLLQAHDGRYQVTDPVFDTGTDIFQHAMMQQFHSQILSAWAKNMDRLGGREQELGILNIPIPAAKIPELTKKIRSFQDEIIGWVQAFEDNDRLVQLGTYLMCFEEKEP